MEYENIIQATFIRRLNRFTAEVKIDGEKELAHVRNTGRCKELLVPGYGVYLEDFRENMGDRKLPFTLTAVNRNGKLINMDSLAPNKVTAEAVISGKITLPMFERPVTVVPERTFRNSRFDLYVEDVNGHKGFVEVKGCTLEHNGIAKFPDAPTLRGEKHIRELTWARKAGYFAAVIFVIQMNGIKVFTPNYATHADFAKALLDAKDAGVRIFAYECDVTPVSVNIAKEVPCELRNVY